MIRSPALRVAGVFRKPLVPSLPRLRRSCMVVSSGLSDGTFSRNFTTDGQPKEIKQTHYDSLVERKLFLETPFKMAAGSKLSHVTVTNGGKTVEVTWDDGVTSRYHSIWLKHACHCPSCRISANQTLVSFQNMDLDATVVSAELEGKVLLVRWSDDEDHIGLIPLPFLKHHDYSETTRSIRSKQTKVVFLCENKIPEIDYSYIMETEAGFYKWLDNVTTYGVCLVKNASTRDKEMLKIIGRIDQPEHNFGHTNVYDVVTDLADPDSFAYADNELPVHQDFQIREASPGVQFLHCVRFDKSITGGESIFVDLFHVAETIRQEHPQEFEDLCRIPASWATIFYRGEYPRHVTCKKPHIALDRDGEIIGIKWHPPSTNVLQAREADVEAYYRAYKLMETTIENFPYKKVFRLEEGDIMTTNNRRWGHGRRKFDKATGKRHLQGGYLDMDTFKSTCQIMSNTHGDGKLVSAVGNNSWE